MAEVVIIDKPNIGIIQDTDIFPIWRGTVEAGSLYSSTVDQLITKLKSDFYTEAEIDELFSINDVGAANFEDYDPVYTYLGETTYYVKYQGTIWKFISDTSQTDVAPDSDPLIWQPVNVGEFAHERDHDTMLASGTDNEVTAEDLRALLDGAGMPLGYVPLNASGKIDDQYMPDLSIVQYLGEVADETAMLALTGEYGDWCIRQDDDKVYVITGADPSQSANWRALSYPGAGLSGAGLADRVTYWTGTGALSYATATLTELNYLSGVTSSVQTQLDAKANLSGAVFTGSIAAPSFLLGASTVITAGGVVQNVSGNISLWTNDIGYLTTADLSSYATQSWVNSQGFLTSTSLTGYATESWVNNQGFLTSASLAIFGTDGQIPFTNPAGDGFVYTNAPVLDGGSLTVYPTARFAATSSSPTLSGIVLDARNLPSGAGFYGTGIGFGKPGTADKIKAAIASYRQTDETDNDLHGLRFFTSNTTGTSDDLHLSMEIMDTGVLRVFSDINTKVIVTGEDSGASVIQFQNTTAANMFIGMDSEENFGIGNNSNPTTGSYFSIDWSNGYTYVGEILHHDNGSRVVSQGNSIALSGGNVTGSGTFDSSGNITFEANYSGSGTGVLQNLQSVTDEGASTSKNVTFTNDILVGKRINHNGDSDTYMQFNGDQIVMVAGGHTIFNYDESSASQFILDNGGQADIFISSSAVYIGGSEGSYNDRVGIGTVTPSQKLDVSGNIRATGFVRSGTGVFSLDESHNITLSAGLMTASGNIKSTGGNYYGSSASTLMNIGTNGAYHSSRLSVNATSVNTSYALYVNGTSYSVSDSGIGSDERIKTYIDSIPNALSILLKIKPYRYRKGAVIQLGYGAQTLQKALKEPVLYDEPNDRYSVSYGQMTAFNTKAIQEVYHFAKSELDQLKDEVKELKNKLNEHGITI
jgi:hypothetical protein